MVQKSSENRVVELPISEGLTLVGYGRDKTGAERFSLWSRAGARAFGGLALAWESKQTARVDYRLPYPMRRSDHLASALPILAVYAFARRRPSIERLVTKIEAEGDEDISAYTRAITEAGFRLAEIDNSSATRTYELLKSSLDETGALKSGFRQPPVRVDVAKNDLSSQSYLNMGPSK